MWYYDSYLDSADIGAKLIYKDKGSYSGPYYGIMNGFPSFGVNHDWKDGDISLGTKIMSGVSNYAREISKATQSAFNTYLEDYDTKTQPNQNVLKQFAGTDSELTLPEFSMLFLCDGEKITNTRTAVNQFVAASKILGDSQSSGSDLVQFPPNNFKYSQEFDPNSNIKGSYTIKTSKYTIKNLLPTSVKFTMSDNLIEGEKCPLYIKIDISFILGRKWLTNDILDMINNTGG